MDNDRIDLPAPASLDDLFGGLSLAAPEPESARQPFKFLDPYGPEDKDIFFGRENETADLLAHFYRGRLLLVYGESGSGKTSLVQCGLRAEIPTENALFLSIRSARDPLAALQSELLKAAPALGERTFDSTRALLEEAIFVKSKPIALFFDQFEELFIFQPPALRQDFFRELRAWLDANLNVRVILCLREEYLARVTEMEALLPDVYRNRYWVRRLAGPQVREVIVNPCAACDVAIEPGLVEALTAMLGKGGREVELPILQVVLDTLYRKAAAQNPQRPMLTHAAYEELGAVESILARFLEERLAASHAPDQMRQVLKTLVSADGTKRLAALADIATASAQFGPALDAAALAPVLEALIHERILRLDPENALYELRHDALAKTVHAWMTGLEKELMEVREALRGRFKEHRARLRSGAAGALLDDDFLLYLAPYESKLGLESEQSEEAGGTLADFVSASKTAAQTRRERQRRRDRKIKAGLSLLLALALVGLVFSLVQYRRAEVQKKLALEVVSQLTYELPDKLRTIPGTLEILQEMFEKNRILLERIAALDLDSTKADREKASNLQKAGDNWLSLGDVARATEAYRQSLAIAERLSLSDPKNTEWQRDLSVSHVKIGDSLLSTGDVSGALSSYRLGLEIRERLSLSDPKNTDWQRDLYVSHVKIGDSLLSTGDVSGALSSYRKALAISERLSLSDPKNTEWQFDLGISHERIGQTQMALGNLTEALNEFRQKQEIIERLSLSDPKNTDWQRDLSVSHEKIGDSLLSTGDVSGALSSYRLGLSIRERLSLSDPKNTQWQRDLSVSHEKIGDILRATGDVSGALSSYRLGLEIRERLSLSDPKNAGWQADLSEILVMTSDALRATGDLAGALQSCRKGYEMAKQLAASDPSNIEWRRNLLISHAKLGVVFRAMGKMLEAEELGRTSVSLSPERADGWGALSFYLLFAGKYAEVIEAAQKGLELDPTQTWIKTNLLQGQLYSGRVDEAKKLYAENAALLSNGKPFKQALLNDFEDFKKAGLAPPHLEEFKAWLEQQPAAR